MEPRLSTFVEIGSIRGGPYRQDVETSGFPACNLYHPGDEFVGAIYSRSMLSTGQGYFLWDIGRRPGRPADHLKRGVGLGDVGVLEQNGHFRYLFNIFHTRSDPIQTHALPRNFQPIQPPLDSWEIHKFPNHFPVGTFLVSQGIKTKEQSKSPLKLQFTTSALEGGILVLPTGASREDLVVTDGLMEYIQEHAIDWYQSLGSYEAEVTEDSPANGALYLITGSDTTYSWATAGFPFRCWKAALPICVDYDIEENDPWMDSADAGTKFSTEAENPGGPGAVIVRGLRVALSSRTWSRKMPLPDPDITPVYRVQDKPLYGYRAKWAGFKPRYFGLPKFSFPHEIHPYHPSNLILQMLLAKTNEGSIAIVDDKIWCSAMNKVNPTYPELLKILPLLFKENDVVISNGIVTLVPKPRLEPDADPSTHPDKLLQKIVALLKPAFVQRAIEARAARESIQSSVKFLK